MGNYELRKKLRLTLVFGIGINIFILLACLILLQITTNPLDSWTKDSIVPIGLFTTSLIFYGRNISLAHDINDLTNKEYKKIVHLAYYGFIIFYPIYVIKILNKVKPNQPINDIQNPYVNTECCIHKDKCKNKPNNKKTKKNIKNKTT